MSLGPFVIQHMGLIRTFHNIGMLVCAASLSPQLKLCPPRGPPVCLASLQKPPHPASCPALPSGSPSLRGDTALPSRNPSLGRETYPFPPSNPLSDQILLLSEAPLSDERGDLHTGLMKGVNCSPLEAKSRSTEKEIRSAPSLSCAL